MIVFSKVNGKFETKHALMKNSLFFLLAFTLLSCGQSIEDVAWIEGTWSRNYNNVIQAEVWKKETDSLIGKAYFIKNGDSTLNEEMYIHMLDGQLTFTAMAPSFEQEKHFQCSESSTQNILFENEHNHFPKAIRYYSQNDSLYAVLGGSVEGFDKTTAFGFKRLP